MPPREIKVVDVINPEGYACDDNVLPEAIEDIDPYPKDDKPVEEQTPQQPSPQPPQHPKRHPPPPTPTPPAPPTPTTKQQHQQHQHHHHHHRHPPL